MVLSTLFYISVAFLVGPVTLGLFYRSPFCNRAFHISPFKFGTFLLRVIQI